MSIATALECKSLLSEDMYKKVVAESLQYFTAYNTFLETNSIALMELDCQKFIPIFSELRSTFYLYWAFYRGHIQHSGGWIREQLCDK